MNFSELSDAVYKALPSKCWEGDKAYREWALDTAVKEKFQWSVEDYKKQGFARRYTFQLFVDRAKATWKLMQKVVETFQPELGEGTQIFDFGAGPGCATAGVASFLHHRNMSASVNASLFDPAEWAPAVEALTSSLSWMNADFRCRDNLQETLTSFKERVQESDGRFIVILSHVLRDFEGRHLFLAGPEGSCARQACPRTHCGKI